MSTPLPEGKTCADCAHVESCVLAGNASRQSAACSFEPPMYLAAVRGSSLVVRRQQEALALVDGALEKMVAGGHVVVRDGLVSLTASGEALCAELSRVHPELFARAATVVSEMKSTEDE